MYSRTLAVLILQAQCRSKCLEDLQSTTRYVTWSLHTKSRSSLKQMLSKVCAPRHTVHPVPSAPSRHEALSGGQWRAELGHGRQRKCHKTWPEMHCCVCER